MLNRALGSCWGDLLFRATYLVLIFELLILNTSLSPHFILKTVTTIHPSYYIKFYIKTDSSIIRMNVLRLARFRLIIRGIFFLVSSGSACAEQKPCKNRCPFRYLHDGNGCNTCKCEYKKIWGMSFHCVHTLIFSVDLLKVDHYNVRPRYLVFVLIISIFFIIPTSRRSIINFGWRIRKL